MRSFKHLLVLSTLAALLAIVPAALAGDLTLNNNGSGTTTWFITGEASLVMNGFDLNAFGVQAPTRIDRVSIDVESATPGQLVDVVIYQDANGGSPQDSTLVRRTQVDITQPGVFSVTFDTPVEITQRFVWVGFYLPVDFEFRADLSGSSVLTYWAWAPGSRFDPSSLSNAPVLGPADGSEPISIAMGGIAKITAEVIPDENDTPVAATTTTTAQGNPQSTSVNPVIRQVTSTREATLGASMITYPDCPELSYDRVDVNVTYKQDFKMFCKTVLASEINQLAIPDGYLRRGMTFDVYRIGGYLAFLTLEPGITHCIRPAGSDLSTALIGLGAGSPRSWEILPTVRFGDQVCAEISDPGFISVFTPNQ